MTAVEITVNLDFRCSYRSKNNREKLLPQSLVMKLFEATSWFCWTRKEALVNCCIACICSWLLVIYILDVDRQATVIYRRVTWSANGFAIMKKQHLSSFVAGQGSLVQCVFMCFSTNFQTSFCGFFVCFCSFFFRWNCISSILRNEFKRFASGAVLSFAKKISASFQF